jgi:hypothetical protein
VYGPERSFDAPAKIAQRVRRKGFRFAPNHRFAREGPNSQTHSVPLITHMALTRSIIAVFVGYIIFAGSAVLLFQVSGHRPHAAAPLSFKAGTVVYGMFFAAAGGWVTAWIAARRPIKHGVLLACVIAAGAIVSLLFSNAAATWSQWSALLLMAPVAIGGSYWRSRQIPA